MHIIIYKKAKATLQNHDLCIERKENYSLTWREATKKLNTQELRLPLTCLDQEDFRVGFHEVYALNDQGIDTCSLNNLLHVPYVTGF